jgi:hypothetical protein
MLLSFLLGKAVVFLWSPSDKLAARDIEAVAKASLVTDSFLPISAKDIFVNDPTVEDKELASNLHLFRHFNVLYERFGIDSGWLNVESIILHDQGSVGCNAGGVGWMGGQAIRVGIESKIKGAGLEHCRSSALIRSRENEIAYELTRSDAYHNPRTLGIDDGLGIQDGGLGVIFCCLCAISGNGDGFFQHSGLSINQVSLPLHNPHLRERLLVLMTAIKSVPNENQHKSDSFQPDRNILM